MFEDYERIRNIKGVKDSDVAKATGIPQSTFSDWKKGKSSPKIGKLTLIADYFGVGVEELSGKKDKEDNILGNDLGIIDIESQICLKNELLHRMLLAGGKVVGEHPELIEAMIYSLEKMGEKK